MGRRVQAVKGVPPKDLLSILIEIRYQKHMSEQSTPQDRRRCDRTAMMNAIAHGVGKSEFLAE
eukprot:1021732-Pyramimonas_sp.AAC.1